jgi:hypothetical protein
MKLEIPVKQPICSFFSIFHKYPAGKLKSQSPVIQRNGWIELIINREQMWVEAVIQQKELRIGEGVSTICSGCFIKKDRRAPWT